MRLYFTFLLMAFCLNGFAQTSFNASFSSPVEEVPPGTVYGQITTTDGQAAAFVTVTLKGTFVTTTSDEDGVFNLKAKPGTYTLEASMTGLLTQQRQVTVKSKQTTTVNIVLQEDAHQLADVMITARRTLNNKPVAVGKVPIDPMNLPQSISIIGKSIIANQQAQRLGDVIKNVNGVYISSTRGSVQESFGARGYRMSSDNFFKNGFRLNSGVMPEMSSLEKVEVLKGSAAILYGEVAPGAVINMVTRQPQFKFGGEVGMRAGSYDLYKPYFDVYGPISTSVGVRLNGTYETANSYRDVVSTKRYYVNPSLLFKIGSATQLLLEGDFLQHQFTPDFGIGSIDNTKISNLPRNRFLGTAWSYNTTRQTTATASLKHLLNNQWTVNLATSYQNYNRDYFSTERIQAKANGDWQRPLGRIDTRENYWAAQANITGKIKTGSWEHTLLTGVDADRVVTNSFDFDFPAFGGLPQKIYDVINILDPEKYTPRTELPEVNRVREKNAPVNRLGVYVQDLVQLSSKFNLLAGVRYSAVTSFGIDSTNLVNGVKTTGTTSKNHAFSPRVGVVYKPLPTTSIFASYSTSFVVNSGSDVYGQPLDPSTIDQYELGVKNEFFRGRLSANVTAYRIKNNNLAQTAEFLADGVTQNNDPSLKVLAGQTTSDGVELDVAGHPTTGLDIVAGYSYNYMRYTKTPKAVGNYMEGERLVNAPAHTANASVFYTLQRSKLKGLKAGITAFYTGNRLAGWNNKIGQSQNYSRIIPVAGFTTIDISAGYSYKHFSVMAKVSNVSDVYNFYVHENYSINPIPPRQFIATVAYKF